MEQSIRHTNAFPASTCKAVVVHGVGRASIDELANPPVGPMDRSHLKVLLAAGSA